MGRAEICVPSSDLSKPGKVALITGIGGQDGGYLSEQLIADGHVVWGMYRGGPAAAERLCSLPWLANVRLVEGDLRDRQSLEHVFSIANPDEVYNLASVSRPALAWNDPESVAEANALGPLRLLELIRNANRPIRFCQASTSEMFGVDEPNPQNELTPIRPSGPYGAAKAYAHQMTGQFRNRYGLFACGAILYNHESSRRPEDFVTRKITRGAARIKLGKQDMLSLGNLNSRRDWGFAPDYVRALRLMLRADQPNDYVVGTGILHTVGDIVEIAFARLGLDPKALVTLDPAFAHNGSPHGLVANAARARDELGWTPSISFETMIEQMVDDDLAAYSATS